jgi:hypothetical protein
MGPAIAMTRAIASEVGSSFEVVVGRVARAEEVAPEASAARPVWANLDAGCGQR